MGEYQADQVQEQQESTKNKRDRTMHLFDLMLKRLLQEASPGAVVQLINGLFGKDHKAKNVTIELPRTESTEVREGKLARLTSDIIININERSYEIEAEIHNDATMALRMFEYGFAHARSKKRILDGGKRIKMRMPDARILYWESNSATPERVT